VPFWGVRIIRIPQSLLLMLLVSAADIVPTLAAPRAVQSTGSQPLTNEIQAQVKGRLKKFYAERGFRPLWASKGRIGLEANSLLGFLKSADLDGLTPSSYDIEDLDEAIADARGGDRRAVARAELALSNALSRYVGDLRDRTRVNMTYVDARLKPKKPKADMVLRATAQSGSLSDYIASMGWMSPHYVRLRTLLSRVEGRDSSDELVRRLRLNLDRARILPGPWTNHIVVDAASGRLWFYQAGNQVGMMRVVVGKASAPTPMMAGMLQYAVLNPYWNIPVDLAQTLIAPKVLAGQSLKSQGIEALSDWGASPMRLAPTAINWTAVASGAQELRLRQLPGGANSMGRVKFMFPNDQGIYLHDTPDRALFARDNRHFSNGCIRLEDAATLGKWLLGRPLRAGSKTPEQPVPLNVPVPVYLTYFTATATKSGVSFLDDVYGRDR
jgi:L,D-transpeptidase YcbB